MCIDHIVLEVIGLSTAHCTVNQSTVNASLIIHMMNSLQKKIVEVASI